MPGRAQPNRAAPEQAETRPYIISLMEIAYRIQHALGRDAALDRLLAKLTPVVPEVIIDDEIDDPNPWRNYRRCLADVPDGITHVCVLQDDALPCRDFGLKVNDVAGEKPSDLISLFVGGLNGPSLKAFRQAQLRNERWCVLPRPSRIIHVVGLLWPVDVAADFLAWYEREGKRIPHPLPHRSDDMVVSYWVKTAKPWHTVWATVPCLVEHDDMFPTTIHRRDRPNDRGRRAISFLDAVT